jgi:hypothetical protein
MDGHLAILQDFVKEARPDDFARVDRYHRGASIRVFQEVMTATASDLVEARLS